MEIGRRSQVSIPGTCYDAMQSGLDLYDGGDGGY